MKKLTAILLVLTMVMSVSVIPVFADGGSVTSIYADMFNITVDFNTVISGIDGNVSLKSSNGTSVGVTTTLSTDGKKLVITPTSNLQRDALYTLEIKQAVGLAQDYTKHFGVKTLGEEDFSNRKIDNKYLYAADDINKAKPLAYLCGDYCSIQNGKLLFSSTSSAYTPMFGELNTLEKYTISYKAVALKSLASVNYQMRLQYNMATLETCDPRTGGYEFLYNQTKNENFRSGKSGVYNNLVSGTLPNLLVSGSLVCKQGDAVWTGTSLTSYDETNTTSYDFRFVKNGKYMKLYTNNYLSADTSNTSIYNYTNDTYNISTGYFQLRSSIVPEQYSTALDDVVCTSFADLDTLDYILNVDTNNCKYNPISGAYEVAFDKDISKAIDFSKVSVIQNSEAVAVVCSISGKILSIKPQNADFDPYTTYTINIDNGFTAGLYVLNSVYATTLRAADLYTTLNIADYYYDLNSGTIIISFDKSIDGFTDFSKVALTKGKENVAISCSVSGNQLTITPTAELSKDIAYDIEIKSGFGAGFLTTSIPFMKQFTLKTIYSQNFDNLKAIRDDDLLKIPGTGKTTLQDGALYLTQSAYFNPNEVANYENYIVEFKGANLSTAPEITFTYNSSDLVNVMIPINRTTGNSVYLRRGWYELFNGPTNLQNPLNVNNTSTINRFDYITGALEPTSKNYTSYSFNTTSGLWEKGTIGTDYDVNEYHYKFVKTEDDANVYLNNSKIISFNQTSTTYKGNFAISLGSGSGFALRIDDVIVSAVEWSTNSISFAGGIDGLSGSYVIKNYSDKSMPIVAVSAAYASDNSMISATVDMNGTIPAYTSQTFNYDFSAYSSNVDKISAFVWDTFDNIKPYCQAIRFENKLIN